MDRGSLSLQNVPTGLSARTAASSATVSPDAVTSARVSAWTRGSVVTAGHPQAVIKVACVTVLLWLQFLLVLITVVAVLLFEFCSSVFCL